MPYDWDDPWGDPTTTPAPRSYDYRTGDGYSFTADQAQAVANNATAFPWMTPGVVTSLGLSPQQNQAQIVDTSLTTGLSDVAGTTNRKTYSKRRLKRARRGLTSEAQFLRQYGKDEWSPSRPSEINYLKAYGLYDTGKGKQHDRAKAIEAADLLEQLSKAGDPRDQVRISKQIDKLWEQAQASEGGSGFGDFAASPLKGLSDSLALGMDAADWAFNDVAHLDEAKPIVPGAKTASRYATAGMQYPYDVLQGSLRVGLSELKKLGDGDFNTAFTEEGRKSAESNILEVNDQSPLVQNLAHGKSLGDGWLPSVESPAWKAAAKAARNASPYLIGGHAWTPGRAIADMVFDPDTAGFQIASGLVDATVALKADPTNIALTALAKTKAPTLLVDSSDAAKALQATNVVETKGGGFVAGLKDGWRAAGLDAGLRKTVNVKTWRSWLLSEEGFPIVRAFKNLGQDVASGRVSMDEAVAQATNAVGEMPMSTVKRIINLGDVPDSEYVRALGELAGSQRGPLNANRVVGGRFLLGAKPGMWSAPLPPSYIDLNDPDQAFKDVQAAGRWVGAPEDKILNVQKMIARSHGSPSEKETIFRAVGDLYQEQFIQAGMSKEWAKELWNSASRRMTDANSYDIDENGLAAHHPFVRIGEDGNPLHDPTLLTEMRNTKFNLPDARTARRIVNGLGEFLNGLQPDDLTGLGFTDKSSALHAWESSVNVLDGLQGLWKQAVLMRPAWGLRVVAEEQLRLAAAGYYSAFRSPLSALAWVVGNPADADYAKRLPRVGAVAGAVAGAAYGADQGEGLDDVFVSALIGGAAGYAGTKYALAKNEEAVARRAKDIIEKRGSLADRIIADNSAITPSELRAALDAEHPIPKTVVQKISQLKAKYGRGASGLTGGFESGLFDEYAQSQYGGFRNLEPTAQAKIRTNIWGSVLRDDPQAARAYAEELGRLHNDQLVRAIVTSGDLGAVKEAFWDGSLSGYRKMVAGSADVAGAARQRREMLTDRQLADDFVDYVAGRVQRAAQNDGEFLDVLATGKWRGTPVSVHFGQGGAAPNPEVFSDPEWARAVAERAPARIRAERMVTRTDAEKKVALGRARKVIDTFFDALMPRPSNYLSRSPHFRQSYWGRVEELFPDMTVAARSDAIDAARAANLDSTTIRRLEQMDKRAGAGKFTLEQADLAAKSHALNQTKDLLYDLSQKSQFFDATRLIFPFGEAWKEIVTRWAQIMWEHPNVIRRAQQGVQAARQATVDPITGLPDPGGVGLFHKDLTTGEESFIFPGTGWFTEKTIGVPVPLVGSAKGLNLIGTGLPGVGPVVQLPVAALLPNSVKYDDVRDLLFPFGEPTGNSPLDAFTSTVMPAWLKKINQAFSNPNLTRLQGNVDAQVATYLLSTGEYDVNGPNATDEIARLLDDARDKGNQFMIIRGFAQAAAPTAPSPQFLVKQGPNLVITQAVTDRYRKRAKKVGWDQAFEELIDEYGPDTALLLAQPKSEAQIPGLTATSDQLTWERTNPDLVERYPEIWTLFAPSGGKFDITAYTQEFERNQRKGLTPEEQIRAGNHRLAAHVYSRQRDALESDDGKLSTSDRARLSALKDSLRADFPGYNPDEYGSNIQNYITQLKDAVEDPQVQDTKAGKAIAAYLESRDAAYRAAASVYVNGKPLTSPWSSSDARAKAIRDRLYAYGVQLRDEVPAFASAWSNVFSNEFQNRDASGVEVLPVSSDAVSTQPAFAWMGR